MYGVCRVFDCVVNSVRVVVDFLVVVIFIGFVIEEVNSIVGNIVGFFCFGFEMV